MPLFCRFRFLAASFLQFPVPAEMAVFLRPGIRFKPVNEILIHADGPLGIDLSGGIGFALQAVKAEDIPHMGFFSVFLILT